MALKAQNKGGKSVMALLHSTGLNRSIVAGKVPASLDTKICMTGRITSRFHTSRPTNLKTLMTIFKQFETAELNDVEAKKKNPLYKLYYMLPTFCTTRTGQHQLAETENNFQE